MCASRLKVGRNDLCPCGSDQKYKKCCLEKNRFDTYHISEKICKESELRLADRVRNNFGSKNMQVHGEVEIKMSEVILEFADELLETTKTLREAKNAVTFACIAWNLALVEPPEEREKKMNTLINAGMNKDSKTHIQNLLLAMVEAKQKYYPDIHRIIIDHELVDTPDGFHLNIVSTVSETDLIT